MRRRRPVPFRTLSMKSTPFSAARQAWVATALRRAESTPFLTIRSAHRAKAS